MPSSRTISLGRRLSILAALAMGAAIFVPGFAASAGSPTEVDPRISDLARSAPETRLEALVSLRSVSGPTDAVDLLRESDEVLALYHGWQGVDSDYVGGYELLGGATFDSEFASYRASYEAMLRETLANIDKSAEGVSGKDAASWARARKDAEDRLSAFLTGDIPVVGARVTASAAVLASWAESAAERIRLIEPVRSGRSIVLPWR